MSKFSEAAGVPTTSHETGTTAPPVPPAPPAPPAPIVTEEIPAPLEYDNPLDEMPVATTEPLDIPTNLKWLSKIKLEEIGRSVGIELDRRLSQPKLVEQLEAHLATIGK